MEVAQATSGWVLAVAGPSGVGKTTVKEGLLKKDPALLEVPASDTDRRRRPDEADGEDYYFITTVEFLRRMETGEYAYTFQHPKTLQWYGMRRSLLEKIWKEGKVALLDIGIDIHNEFNAAIPNATIFFLAASKSVRKERIILRKDGMTPEEIELRLEKGEEEIKLAKSLRAPFGNVRFISNETSSKEIAVSQILTIFHGQRPRSSQESLFPDIEFCFSKIKHSLTRLMLLWGKVGERLRLSKS